MKGLASDICNALNEYKLTIDIKKRDLLATSRAAVNLVSTDESTVEPEITKTVTPRTKPTYRTFSALQKLVSRKGLQRG